MKMANTPDAKYSGSYEPLLKATFLFTNSLDEVALLLGLKESIQQSIDSGMRTEGTLKKYRHDKKRKPE